MVIPEDMQQAQKCLSLLQQRYITFRDLLPLKVCSCSAAKTHWTVRSQYVFCLYGAVNLVRNVVLF